MKPACFAVLSLIPLALLLHGAAGAEPLYTICSSSGNYTAGDRFGHDLHKVVEWLTIRTSPTGYSFASIVRRPADGPSLPGSKAYGLALCRGDVQRSACRACVADAGNQILQLCPTQRRAVIWFDECLLRYSDEDFSGVIDDANRFYMWNTQSVPDPASFDGKVAELMGRVAAEAAGAPRLFATDVADAGEDGTLYGLAQCTRDLAAGDCLRCLQSAVAELPTCCGGKRGGRVVGASCNFRYELYPFFSG